MKNAKLIWLLIGLSFSLCLAACGGGGGGGGGASAPNGTIPPPQAGLEHSLAIRVADLLAAGEKSIPVYVSRDRYNCTDNSNPIWLRVESASGSGATISMESKDPFTLGIEIKYFMNEGSLSIGALRPEDAYRPSSPSAEQVAEANFISLRDWPCYGDVATDFIRVPQTQLTNGRWKICEINLSTPSSGVDKQIIILAKRHKN